MFYFLRWTFFQGIVRFQCFLSQLCKDLISKTVIIAIKLFLVMILKLYLTSKWSQSKRVLKTTANHFKVLKSDFVVAVL